MPSARLVRTLSAAALAVACGAFAYSGTVRTFSTTLPLGTEVIVLQPAEAVVYVMASAQSPAFEGLRMVSDGRRTRVLDAEGRPVSVYPARLDFRVTASMLSPHDLGYDPYPVATDVATDAYLCGLKFRVKLYRGLARRVLQPVEVEMIGVPADVPYDERTYRVSFEMKDVSVEERLLFEVLSPDGQRLARFHLPLD